MLLDQQKNDQIGIYMYIGWVRFTELVVEKNTVVGSILSEQLFRHRQCFHSVFIVSINVRTLKIIELRRQKTLVIIIAFSLTGVDFHARKKGGLTT